MKKYILVLLAIGFSLSIFAQTTKTEKIKFSVRDSDTEYSIKSSFPAERSERLRIVLQSMLGEATKSSTGENQWSAPAYQGKLSTARFEAVLDKKKATGHQVALFKELTEKLQEALDQPKPPKPPKTPLN